MIDVRPLLAALVRGDAQPIVAAMAPEPVVQDQRLGRLDGVEGVRRWVTDSAAWLEGLKAQPSEVALIASDRRVVYELSLSIRVDDGVVDLPYVLVADLGENGVTELRTYHSTWPYTGGHVFRAPPLAGREQEAVPEVFHTYIERVKVADVDAVLKSFTDDGYMREPSGNRWRHAGEDLVAFYGHLVHAPAAQFDLMTSTVDGGLIAVEYGFAYGDVEFVGGICIMEVVGDRIAAVRVTDDVSA